MSIANADAFYRSGSLPGAGAKVRNGRWGRRSGRHINQVQKGAIRMPRESDDEDRIAEASDFRAAVTFLLVMLTLIVVALSLGAYLCWVMVGWFRGS
jgi:hypothetical protein